MIALCTIVQLGILEISLQTLRLLVAMSWPVASIAEA